MVNAIFFFLFALFAVEIQQLILFCGPKMAGSSYMSKCLEYVASTQWGQFFIKKIDTVLWAIEMPAKSCVEGESKGDSEKMPWPVFWTVFIYLQLFVIVSKVLVILNINPIAPKDIVIILQKWRRTLRCVRFRGLRTIRESRFGAEKSSRNGGKLFAFCSVV